MNETDPILPKSGYAALTALKWLGLALAGFAYLVALVFLLAVAADFVAADFVGSLS